MVATLYREQLDNLIKEVEIQRRPKPNLQDQKWNLNVDNEYINELLRYDFTSTKKGRGFTSLLVQKKRDFKTMEKQNPTQPSNTNGDILQ